jgi:hypothetical protein
MIAHRIEDEEASTERTMIAHRIEDEEASTEQASAAPRVEDEEASTEQASAAPRVEDEEASTERTMIAHRIEDEEASTEQASAAPRAMGEEISTERTTAAPESQGLLMRGGAIKSAYNPLDRLEPVQRNQLVFASYLAENFTCNELAAVLGISQQEAIDIIKTTLSLRILVIHPSTVDACYSFLYPSYRKILTDGLPIEHRRELAYKAALAMSQQREQYHRQHNASLLARRFTEGQQPVESLRWQLYAVEQAFASQVENALQEALRQLRELLLHWSVKGATKQLLHAVPRLIASRKSQTNSIWEQTINHLLSQGILQNLNLSLLARHQATVTRQSLETLIVEVRRKRPDALDLLHKRLSPLLQFAQVEFTS